MPLYLRGKPFGAAQNDGGSDAGGGAGSSYAGSSEEEGEEGDEEGASRAGSAMSKASMRSRQGAGGVPRPRLVIPQLNLASLNSPLLRRAATMMHDAQVG